MSILDQLRPILAQKDSLERQIEDLMPRLFNEFKERLDQATTKEHMRVLCEELDEWPTSTEWHTARRLARTKLSEGKLQ